MSEHEEKPVKSRKRKKTYIENVIKHGKRGYYGHGNQLDENSYNYLVDVMKKCNGKFDSEEARRNYVNDFFKSTGDAILDYCRNQIGCRLIESILPEADASVLEKYITTFSSDLRPLCSDRFASHILELLVMKSCQISLDASEPEEVKEKFRTFFLKVSKFLLNNMEDYIWDQYGNHIFRICIGCASQLPLEDFSNKKTGFAPVPADKIPDDFKEIVQDCAVRLIGWPQFQELCSSELTSGFLQVLVKACNRVEPKLTKQYIKKFITGFDSSSEHADNDLNMDSNSQDVSSRIPLVFMSTSTIALLEVSLQLAEPKLFKKIYKKHFRNRLPLLAKTRMTNFAVQKLLTNCTDKTQFEAIYDELADHMSEVIQVRNTGVILALAQACKRLSARQGPFVESLMKSFDCAEENKQDTFILCLSRFQPCSESSNQNDDTVDKEKLNLHGTLVLQTLLEFNKPIRIVNGLLSMETNTLKKLFSNTMGSHIMDSFVTSQYVGQKSREKLIKKLQGTYKNLASTKYGSRSFEAIWNVASLKYKLSIMAELADKEGAWSSSQFGRIIASKLNISLYKRSKEAWIEYLNRKKIDPKEVFADLLK